MCVHCSKQEKTAADAERDSIKFMQVKFMEKHLGETFTGVISGVAEFGFWVEIPENGAEFASSNLTVGSAVLASPP